MVGLMSQTMQQVHESGVTILFHRAEHRQSLRLADRGYSLESGRLVMSGKSAAMLADERMHQFYLGLE